MLNETTDINYITTFSQQQIMPIRWRHHQVKSYLDEYFINNLLIEIKSSFFKSAPVRYFSFVAQLSGN